MYVYVHWFGKLRFFIGRFGFPPQNGDITAIQSEIDLGADVEMDTISSTNSLKPIFLAFLHDHNQVLNYILFVFARFCKYLI